jgi:hypothetical protein
VSVLSPASGSTLADIVRIQAEATDDVGVVGVQFKLNGFDLGVEDTTAPYGLAFIAARCRTAVPRLWP